MGDYQTALMWAAAEGHLEVVQGLTEKYDAKWDILSKQGKTALMLAARFGRHEVVGFLLTKHSPASLEQADEEGRNVLFHAVTLGDEKLCEMLLAKDLDLDRCNKKGETVLMLAASRGSASFVAFLLGKKANLGKQDESGRTALDHAESTLNSPVVQMLRERHKQIVVDEIEE